jgi:hypothetical protein
MRHDLLVLIFQAQEEVLNHHIMDTDNVSYEDAHETFLAIER